MDERLKDGLIEFKVKSSYDGTEQPNLFLPSDSGEKRPLLVGLHTWSFDRFNQIGNMLPYAKENGFHLLLPEFRGPNLTSNPNAKEACGSEAAMKDIIDAIDYVCENYPVDEGKILLLGHSGGGHMSLMMAGNYTERFLAIGAFVPISDLAAWTEEAPGYAKHVKFCTDDSTEEMLRRSPVSYLEGLSRANLKIFHGKYDGCVPVTQSIKLYNKLMAEYPRCRVFLDVFDGGHQLDMSTAAYWFSTQLGKVKLTDVTG